MRSPQGFERSLLMAVCLASSVTARSAHNLFERQTVSACPVSNFVHCSRAGLPSDFCCPTGQTCIPLAANTTVLCCPNGSDCSVIKPIICDIQQQNTTAHPDNTLKTIELNVALPTCGSSCCPFGFTCNTTGNCVKNADQTIPPEGRTSSAPSSTATTTPKPASTPSSNTTAPLPLTAQCNKFPAIAVVAGFFPGFALGAALALLIASFVGVHKKKEHAKRRSGSSFGNISDPQPTSDMRTDFLRKPPPTPSTTRSAPTRRNTIQRVRSIFGKSPSPNGLPASPAPPMPLNIRRPMPQEQRPVTPIMQREPSYEDISIFTDGNTASSLRKQERQNGRLQGGGIDVRASHQTTFSDIMDRSGVPPAGLKKNSPYVYKGSPTYNSPGSR
ncbi:hypothetical protein F5882DRAFT_63813 [Hyaloscypha sp. PMI_1271]|nr:hypothetical protein F5882DRAFT_63813 [Hyaloscypha sp. PMI_1271]